MISLQSIPEKRHDYTKEKERRPEKHDQKREREKKEKRAIHVHEKYKGERIHTKGVLIQPSIYTHTYTF